MDMTLHLQILGGGLLLGVLLGAVTYRTHFCTLGAISDWLNIGDRGRLGAWLLAIAVALAGTAVLEGLGLLDLGDTRPPYRSATFAWARYVLGGFLFGAGMALAGGCVTKNLLRLGGGSLKALVTLLVIGGCVWLMTRTDFYAIVFHSWLEPLSLNLSRFNLESQDFGSLLALLGSDVRTLRLLLGVGLAVLLAGCALRLADVRRERRHVVGGVVVGLCVVGGWWLTGGAWGQGWIESATWADIPPLGVSVQSFTFVNPLGETLGYLAAPTKWGHITFGVATVTGVLGGALGMALASHQFRIEWFVSWGDFCRHIGGAVLMGVGGVLALGCTVGQGISGVSTLALGSLLALGAIGWGSATVMKIMYYRMLYEQASLLDALLSSWVDLKLLPRTWRRLEAL